MSDEAKTDNPNSSPATSEPPPPTSETAESANQTEGGNTGEAAGADEATIDVDALLAQEDPEFTNSMNELKTADLKGPVEEAPDMEQIPSDKDPVPAVAKWPVRVFRRGLAVLGGLLGWIWSLVKNAASGFWQLPRTTKLTALSVLTLMGLLGFVVELTRQGEFMPSLETEFVRSWGQIADRRYEFGPDEKFEDFDSPLRHPEYVVLVDKIVVNLRPGDMSEGNPMGMFEFYVEAGSREAAIELGDRHKEVLDLMQRTLEAISYDELITIEGKARVKLLLQRNLSSFLTQGRVRKVFFKSIVLKP